MRNSVEWEGVKTGYNLSKCIKLNFHQITRIYYKNASVRSWKLHDEIMAYNVFPLIHRALSKKGSSAKEHDSKYICVYACVGVVASWL